MKKNKSHILTRSYRGKYINLEFAYLMEMSKIDMYFRKLIMKMALDVEHFLKTQMLRDFVDNSDEDGYDIIDYYARLCV